MNFGRLIHTPIFAIIVHVALLGAVMVIVDQSLQYAEWQDKLEVALSDEKLAEAQLKEVERSNSYINSDVYRELFAKQERGLKVIGEQVAEFEPIVIEDKNTNYIQVIENAESNRTLKNWVECLLESELRDCER